MGFETVAIEVAQAQWVIDTATFAFSDLAFSTLHMKSSKKEDSWHVTRKGGVGHADFSSIEGNGSISSKREEKCCDIMQQFSSRLEEMAAFPLNMIVTFQI